MMLDNQFRRKGYFDPRIVFNINNYGNLYLAIVEDEETFDGIKFNFELCRDITLIVDVIKELIKRGKIKIKRSYPLSSGLNRDYVEKQRTRNQLENISRLYLEVVDSMYGGSHNDYKNLRGFDVYIDELGIKYGYRAGERFNVNLVYDQKQVKILRTVMSLSVVQFICHIEVRKKWTLLFWQ